MNIAILSGSLVENVIIAESVEAALAVIGDVDLLQVTDATGPAYIGGDFYEGRFRPPSPYPSWEWNGSEWEAPIPYPIDGAAYVWDEDRGDWIEYVAPEPAPEE